MELKDLVFQICSLMSINGYEYSESEKLIELVGPLFDECQKDNVGNHIFIKKCGKPNAKKLFIDTHFDEVGLMVKGITKEGFLRVCSIGGVDARLLPGAELCVYGKTKVLAGIGVEKPSCIKSDDDKPKLTSVSDTLIDVGLPKDEVDKEIEIGTPVGFKPVYGELQNGYWYGKGMDDKVCAAAVVRAVEILDKDKMEYDLYFSMSCREEVGHRAVSAATYRIEPDAAIALDVTFGMAPDGKKGVDMKMGGGPVLSQSLILNQELYESIKCIADDKVIDYQVSLEGVHTGTHADDIAFVGRGVPTALISIPVYFMHTAIETVMDVDIENTAKLIAAILENKEVVK